MAHKHSHLALDTRSRLLLLDDDEVFCETLQTLLELEGFKVTVVHKGVDGVRELMERDFDAIICDMNMPTMPGNLFYLAVQRMKPHLCRRFIFVTGDLGNPAIARFLAGAEGYKLYKPISTTELVEKVVLIMNETDILIKADDSDI